MANGKNSIWECSENTEQSLQIKVLTLASAGLSNKSSGSCWNALLYTIANNNRVKRNQKLIWDILA